MGLETGNYISALVSTNPIGATDPKSQGDDHIRFIKTKLLETFPNVTGAVTASHTELNLTVGASQGLATLSVSFAALQTLVGQMGSFSASVTSSDITGSIRAPVLKTQAGFTAGTFTAATVVVSDKGIITNIAAGIANTKLSGDVVQIVNFQTGLAAQNNTVIPDDDTIPQNTEGTEYMSLAITPTSATNKLKIDVVFQWGLSALAEAVMALFQDTTVNALAVSQACSDNANGLSSPICLTHYMTAGTTSATTFKVRAGGIAANTLTFNGKAGAARFGGSLASSITITEIKV